jgi:hypothetical protein
MRPRTARRNASGDIGFGEDRDHTRMAKCRFGVDRHNPCSRVYAAEDRREVHSGQRHIIYIYGRAGNEPRVFAAANPLPDKCLHTGYSACHC